MENKKGSGIEGAIKNYRYSSRYLLEKTGMGWKCSMNGSGKES